MLGKGQETWPYLIGSAGDLMSDICLLVLNLLVTMIEHQVCSLTATK